MSSYDPSAAPPRADGPDGPPTWFDAILAWFRSAVATGRQELPGMADRAKTLGSGALRQGASALSANHLTSAGVDFVSAFVAVATTTLFYAAVNWYLISWMVNSYTSFRPARFANVTTSEQAKQAFVAAGWLEEAAAEKLNLGTSNDTLRGAFPLWIEDVFFHTGVDSQKRDLSAILRRMTTGDCSGWVFVTLRATTGPEVLRALQEHDGPNGHIESTIARNSTRKRLFLGMCDELAVSVQQPLRWLFCLNGSIQYLTIALSLFVLTAIARRYAFVARLTYRWLSLPDAYDPRRDDYAPNTADHELNAIARRAAEASQGDSETFRLELDRLREETDRCVYDVYWFISGMLPSLGFIGTVVGMSAALLMADRLFTAGDRQLAISEMTKELGLAFDTTLIALIMGLLVSIPLSAVRARELTFYREFAQRFGGPRASASAAEVMLQ